MTSFDPREAPFRFELYSNARLTKWKRVNKRPTSITPISRKQLRYEFRYNTDISWREYIHPYYDFMRRILRPGVTRLAVASISTRSKLQTRQ